VSRRRLFDPPRYDDLSLREVARDLWKERAEADAHNRRAYGEWARLAPEPKFGTLDFARFPFQAELASQEVALATELVLCKATQVGVSMLMWRWAAWRADVWGDTALYIFPTEKHVSKFGDERIEPSIQASPYLTRRIPAEYVRQKQLKRIGNGWLHLQGANSRAGAQSVAADVLVFDEYDELDQSNVEQIERRISGAAAAGRLPRVRRVGIPTIPGFGMDAAYKRSDQRRWFVTCEACGHETWPTFESLRWRMPGSDAVLRPGHDEFTDPGEVSEAWRVCRECEAPIDVSRGEWRPTRSSRVPGYHVARLIVPNTDLTAIVKASRMVKPHEVQAFYNNDLGEAYQAADAGVTPEEVLRACSFGGSQAPSQGPQVEPVVMGVDVASSRNLHAVVQRVRRDGSRDAMWMGELGDFAAVDGLIERYAVTLTMIDHLPETRSARSVQADWPGRVLLAAYAEHPSAEPFVLDLQRGMVTANRTILLDAMLEAVRKVRYRPLRRPPGDYVEHLCALHRLTEVREKDGLVTHRYISTGADDFAHAEGYALLAAEALLFEEIATRIFDSEYTPATDEALGFERVILDTEKTEVYSGGMEQWTDDFSR
jgi:hypothetical protein